MAQIAFPSAVGAGAYNTGARGTNATVYHVTNLNDSGTGSLRDAVSQSNRYVVFDVSGVIFLTSRLATTSSNITLAGQTAPAGGITVAGDSFRVNPPGSNWIIRYVKFRGGFTNDGESPIVTPDAFGTLNVGNIIIDHCSMSFAEDEAGTMTEDGGNINIGQSTMMKCLLAESHTGSILKGTQGYTSYLNLYYNITHRFPNFAINGVGAFDIINNVAWNYQNRTIRGNDQANVIIEGNYYDIGTTPIEDKKLFLYQYAGVTPTIYCDGNHFVNQNVYSLTYSIADVNANNWKGWYAFDNSLSPYTIGTSLYDNAPQFFTGTKRAYLGVAPTVLTAAQALDSVKVDIGANKQLNGDGTYTKGWDYVDQTWMDNVISGTYVDAMPSAGYPQPGGYYIPIIASVSRSGSYDTDGDGMPDVWETATFGDLTQTATGDFDFDGYENIEQFLNLVDETSVATASFTLGSVSGNTTEVGGTAAFTIVLDVLPTSNVVFDISSNDETEGLPTTAGDSTPPIQMTFTAANWDTPQIVTVTGQDDGLGDGNVVYAINVSVNDASSADEFDVLPDQQANILNIDDEGTVTKSKALRMNGILMKLIAN